MILDRFSLKGKVAIVTGAGRGIGQGIALGLAEAGADVVCTARTVEQIEGTAAQVRQSGRKVLGGGLRRTGSGPGGEHGDSR